MFITLVRQAVRARYGQWLLYGGIGLGFLLLYVSVFPSIQSQASNYDQLYATLPKAFISAFNITNIDPTLLGFLSSKHFGLMWPLLIILCAISYSSFAIAREVELKTMGFLLAQPIKRQTLYAARFTTGCVGLLLLVVLSELIVWPLAAVAGYAINGQAVVLIGLVGLLFGTSVLSMGMFFSALATTAGQVRAYISAVLVSMYAIFIAASLVPEVANIKYLSLFHYFDPGKIVGSGAVEFSSILVFVVWSLIWALAGVFVFKKREVQV